MEKDKKKRTVGENRLAVRDAARGERGLPHLLPVLFLLGATFLAYVVALKGTWAFDDSAIGQFASIKNALTLHLGYRKIAYLSFLVNRWIDPVSPVNYRITNILIHVCNALLVYAIVLKTMRLPAWKERYGAHAFGAALLSATIFALHPININAVSYIVQRMTSLAAMFVLLSLLCYISARNSSGGLRAIALYGAAVFFISFGIFSKENAVLAIPLVALYDIAFLSSAGRKGDIVVRAAAVGLGLLLLGAAAALLHFDKALWDIGGMLLHPHRRIPDFGWTAADVYWTPAEHILTEFRVIGRYLFLLACPLPRFLVFDWWGFPLSTGMVSPVTTLVSALLVLSLVSVAAIKFRKLPFLSFGILWYFIALTPESFAAVGSDLYFEHRNYLPLAGLAFGVAAEAVAALKGRANGKRSVWAAVIAVALLLGGLTVQRNLVWKDSITLWKDTVEKAPGNLRAMIALGNACLEVQDLPRARAYFRDAVQVSSLKKMPHFVENSAYSLAMTYLFSKDLDRAKEVISIMEGNKGDSVRTSIVRGFYDAMKGSFDDAISRYKHILPRVSGLDRVVVYTLLGEACYRKGLAEEAIRYYGKAVELEPSFSAAYFGLGTVYLDRKELGAARHYIGQTLSLDSRNAVALSEMARLVLMENGPPERAEEYARRALMSSPESPVPCLAMGTVLIVMGKEDAAENYFSKAASLGAERYLMPFSRARAYFLRGEKEKAKQFLGEAMSLGDMPPELKRSIGETMKQM